MANEPPCWNKTKEHPEGDPHSIDPDKCRPSCCTVLCDHPFNRNEFSISILDERPILTYKGRRIEIDSGGLWHNTVVKVDGKVIDNIVFLTFSVNPREIVKVTIGMRDFP